MRELAYVMVEETEKTQIEIINDHVTSKRMFFMSDEEKNEHQINTFTYFLNRHKNDEWMLEAAEVEGVESWEGEDLYHWDLADAYKPDTMDKYYEQDKTHYPDGI